MKVRKPAGIRFDYGTLVNSGFSGMLGVNGADDITLALLEAFVSSEMYWESRMAAFAKGAGQKLTGKVTEGSWRWFRGYEPGGEGYRAFVPRYACPHQFQVYNILDP